MDRGGVGRGGVGRGRGGVGEETTLKLERNRSNWLLKFPAGTTFNHCEAMLAIITSS